MARTPAKKSSAKKTPSKKSAAKPKRSSKTAPAAKKKTAKRKTTKKPVGKKPIAKSTKTKIAKAPSAKATATKAKAAKTKATSTKAKTPAKKMRRKSEEITLDRRDEAPRRDDEATPLEPVVVDGTTLERREKVNRRRQIDPTTCERDYSDREVEFMNAMDEYKRKNGRMFPTCSEVLEVIRELGYTQLSPAEIAVRKADEAPVEGDFDSQVETEANEALEMSDELRNEAFDEMD